MKLLHNQVFVRTREILTDKVNSGMMRMGMMKWEKNRPATVFCQHDHSYFTILLNLLLLPKDAELVIPLYVLPHYFVYSFL